MAKKLVKDMTEQERAERGLRRRLARERRTYGLIGRVDKVEHWGKDEEGYHGFVVTFDTGNQSVFDVKVYSKSVKVYQG